MDTFRVGARDPILLLTRAADKLVSLKPGEVIRAQVVEVLPGGELNLRIQGNLFRARSQLQLPENANVLFRVLGQKTGEGASEIRLQFLEVAAPSEAEQMPQKPLTDALQTLTQELASNLAVKTQTPSGLAATVERLLKALPDDASRIPPQTREQLLTLLQTSLRTTGQSIQDRLNVLLRQFMDQDSPPMRELASIKEQVFADIETISQIPLKSSLANTGVGLEARLRVLAEALAEAGGTSLRNPLPALGADQSVRTTPLPLDLRGISLPPELKDALVQLNQQGVPLPPELKQALQQLDLKGISLPPELKDVLVQLNQQGVPLPPELKQALQQLDLKGISLPPELKDALMQLNQQGVPLPPELKQALQQLDLKGISLPPELKDALVQLNQQGVPLPPELKLALQQLDLKGISLPPELKDALVQLNQQGVPLPPELKQALQQLDLKGISLPPELKDALVQLNQQGVPLPPELKQALQQLDLKGISLPPELKDALVRLNQQGVPLPQELKQAVQQLDLKGISLPPELKDALVQLNQQGVPLPPELKQALQQLDLKGISLPPELKDALVQLNQQGVPLPADQQTSALQPQLQTDPLHADFKARLLQLREMVLEQQAQLLRLDLSERIAHAGPLNEKKAMLDQMLKSVDGLLQDVETFQLLSKLTDSFYTFLPFIWKGLKEADIAFKRSGSGPQGRSYYCLVHLDLEELGKLEVVAMMAGSEFFITFKTDHDTFRSVLNANMNELQEMFAAKGLKLGLVSFYDMQEKQLAPFERLESFESIINIRI